MAKTLTRKELAKLLGCDARTVSKWQEEGLPVAVRGRGGRPSRYDEAQVQAWIAVRTEAGKREGALDWSQERALKEHWQAQLSEQLHAARARDLLPRVEVEKEWSAFVTAIRSKLLSWAATLTDRLDRARTLHGLPGMERAIDEAVRDVLRELAGEQAASTQKRRKGRAA